MSVFRCYSEKKPGFDVEAQGLCRQLREQLGVESLESVRILNRYDADHIDPAVYQAAKTVVFSEPRWTTSGTRPIPLPTRSTAFWRWRPSPASSTSGPTPAPSASSSSPAWTAPSSPTPRSTSWAASCPRTNWRRSASTLSTVESREASVDKPATLVREHAAPDRVAVWRASRPGREGAGPSSV